MIHLKSFINFINEGAWYEGDKVFLSTKNDPNNPNELLKTVEPNNKNFKDRGIKVYYGLYPRKNYKSSDNESVMAKTQIMDRLKAADTSVFSMAPGEKIEDFIDYTLLRKIKGDINYIVRVGSSADLVSVMSDSLQKIYPDALTIDLNKIKYRSASDAIDWDSFNRKRYNEWEKDRFDKEGNPDDPHSNTHLYVDNWWTARDAELADLIAQGKEPWFHIKSSGVQGGIRGALRPKYDTASDAFINAVHHCAFGDKNGNLGKMVLIDDNANEGIDFRNISNKVYEILAGIIDITKNNTRKVLKSQGIFSKISSEYKNINIARKLDAQLDNFLETDAMDNIKNNIIGYVLYDFNRETNRVDLDDLDYAEILKEITSEVVPSISKKIEDGRYFEMTREEYDEAKKKIINKAIGEVQNISTYDRDKIAFELLRVFKEKNILPENIRTERSTVPKYPEAAHLVNGILIRHKKTGKIGKLVNVNQINGQAYVEYEGENRPAGPLDLKIMLKLYDLL